MTWLRTRDGARDAALALLMFAGTVLYLWSLPLNLSFADEAIYLYESKRILDGDVLYRDIFEMITPVFMYVIAALFWLFGATLQVARLGQAVVHGITVVALYATCRQLGIRRSLAWLAPVGYVAICQSAWPTVSQHWLSTMVCVLILLSCVRLRRDRVAATVVPGMLLGLLIGIQQQRGAIMAVGVFVWVILDTHLQRRLEPEHVGPPLIRRLAWLVAGALIIDVPVLTAVVVHSGWQPAWRAMVIFPLFDYRSTTFCEWGHLNIMTYLQSTYTFPRFLKYLPVVLPIPIARLALLMARRQGGDEARRLTLLLTFVLFSIISILYFPDFIHIAFIAAFFFIIIVETLEWIVQRLPAAGATRAVGWATAAVLLAATAYHLNHNRDRLIAANPFMRSTQFGEIAMHDEVNAKIYDRVVALAPQLPDREIYCFPIMSHLYLMAGVQNPTPYGFLLWDYSGPDLINDVVRILSAKRLPYLVVWMMRDNDPISDYIRREYEPVDPHDPVDKFIYRRKRA
jgi:hypothetical protein